MKVLDIYNWALEGKTIFFEVPNFNHRWIEQDNNEILREFHSMDADLELDARIDEDEDGIALIITV